MLNYCMLLIKTIEATKHRAWKWAKGSKDEKRISKQLFAYVILIRKCIRYEIVNALRLNKTIEMQKTEQERNKETDKIVNGVWFIAQCRCRTSRQIYLHQWDIDVFRFTIYWMFQYSILLFFLFFYSKLVFNSWFLFFHFQEVDLLSIL